MTFIQLYKDHVNIGVKGVAKSMKSRFNIRINSKFIPQKSIDVLTMIIYTLMDDKHFKAKVIWWGGDLNSGEKVVVPISNMQCSEPVVDDVETEG